MMVELWTRKRGMGDEDENDKEDMSGYEKSGVLFAWLGWEDLVSVLVRAGSGLAPAISGMVNWLAHENLQVPASHDDFPRSLTFLCSTLPSPKYTNLSHPSLSLHAIIMSYHRVQHTPSTASSQDRQSPAPSQFLIQLQVNQWIESQLPSRLPPNRPPPCTSPISLDHSLQVHLQTRSVTASECISKLDQSRPPSASSEFTRSQPPSASLRSFDLRLQVDLKHARSSTSSRSDGGCTEIQG